MYNHVSLFDGISLYKVNNSFYNANQNVEQGNNLFQINGIVNKKRLDLSFYFSYCNEVFKLNKKNYVCKFY